MKYGYILISLAIASSILISQSVWASQVAPGPMCKITAKVLEIKKVEEKTDNFGNQRSSALVYYKAKLDITDISTAFSQDGIECDKNYINSDENAFIISLTDYSARPVNSNETIQSYVERRGDEFSSGWYLRDVVVVDDDLANIEAQNINDNLWYWTFIVAIPLLVAVMLYMLYIIRAKKKSKKIV